MRKLNWRDEARIIGAIAFKDILDALKNRTTLSILVGVGVLVLSSMAFPLLLRADDRPAAVVYDPGRSTLIRALTTREEFRLRFVDSQEELEAVVGGAGELALGIVVPEGFREVAGAGGSVEIAGYVPHWATPAEVAALVAFFEDTLSTASWQTVRIDVAGHMAYPALDVMGYPHTIASSFTIAVLTVGLALVPHLLIEERETHTFEALLVSPARYHQVVLGKMAAGLSYCLFAGAIVLLLNARWVARWPVALLALLLGAAFAVALGLFLGSFFESAASMNTWMALVLLILLLPVFLVGLGSTEWPAVVHFVVRWLPSVAVDELVWASLSRPPAATTLGGPVAILVGSVLLLLLLGIWRVRGFER